MKNRLPAQCTSYLRAAKVSAPFGARFSPKISMNAYIGAGYLSTKS